MKKSKTNSIRVSIFILFLLTVFCRTVVASELQPVYKKTLPTWWEKAYDHRNMNPNMLDEYPEDPRLMGPDGKVDSWKFEGYNGSTCVLSYLGGGVNIQVSEEPGSTGKLFDYVSNDANETKFKEFAFRLQFRTEDSFCPDTGTALASLKVRINFSTPDPCDNWNIDGFAESKEYTIFEEGQIYWGKYKDGNYYEVEICDRIDWQPESEQICLNYYSSGWYAWPHNLSISTFDFRTKCFEPIDPNYFLYGTYMSDFIFGINNCEFTYDPISAQCSIAGSIDGQEFDCEDDCPFTVDFKCTLDPNSQNAIFLDGSCLITDCDHVPILGFDALRITANSEPNSGSTQIIIDCCKPWIDPHFLDIELFSAIEETPAWPAIYFDIPLVFSDEIQNTEPTITPTIFTGPLCMIDRFQEPPVSFLEDFSIYYDTSDLRGFWHNGGNSPEVTIDLLSNPDGIQFMKIYALICDFTPYWAWATYTFPEPIDLSSLMQNGVITVVGAASNSGNTPTKVYVELIDTEENSSKVCTDGNWTSASLTSSEMPLISLDGNANLRQTNKLRVILEASDFSSGYSEIIIDKVEVSAPKESSCDKECNILDEITEGFNNMGLDFGSQYIEKITRIKGGETVYEQMPSTIECGEIGDPQKPLEVRIQISNNFEILPNSWEVARRVNECGIQQQGAHYIIIMKIYSYCDPEDGECYCRVYARMTKVETAEILMSYYGEYNKCDKVNELITKHLENFQRSPNSHIPPFEFKNEDSKWKCSQHN